MIRQLAHSAAALSLIVLIFVCLLWESLLAPLRPGGSALIFKALPLLAPLFGVLRGKRYTFQWASLMLLVYLCEGLVRAYAEDGMVRTLALMETTLAISFVAASLVYLRSAAKA